MNKIKLFLVATIITLAAGTATAQKTGYIRVDDVVSLMPEVTKLNDALTKYQNDTLQPRFNYTLAEYQRKDSIINGKDSLRTAASVRAKMREEMQQDLYELQNWQAIVQNAMQAKEQALLEPLYKKAIDAIQTVAKENGYGYVYTKDALLVAPPADDLLPLVAKKLKLTLPTNAGTGNPAAANNTTTPKKQ
ncbi:MAG TPA: OmpH family outer membrane protein [Flavisolibacter sp.]|jgi:outer membrane protein